jgi:outer membrane lipoprotein carrier protein
MSMRVSFVALALAVGGSALFAQSQTPPPAAEFARQLQAHYNTVRDFTADFTHQYRGGVLRQSLTERGHVSIKKPGRMNWVYTSPERKEFMSDGTKLFSYVPSDKVVVISDLPTGDQASTALLFLTGRGDLVRDFRPAVPKTHPDGVWQLDLVPNTAQSDFTSLTMLVAPGTLALRGLTSTDAQEGVSTFTFTNLRENVGLSDNQFTFTIPKGVDIRR